MNRLGLSTIRFVAVFSFFGFTFFAAFAAEDNVIISAPKLNETEVTNSDNKNHISQTSEVSFSYPQEWSVQERTINSIPYIRLENINSEKLKGRPAQGNYFKIEILTFPDKGLSLDMWVDEQNKKSQPGQNILERKGIEVDGERAVHQVEQYTDYNHTSEAVFVAKGNKVYIINFSNNKEENRATAEEFLSSFHFNF